MFIGLGSRMNVFQNKLVDKITKYHEIDLELPGKEPCAYFCIISAQDTAYEFLSSLFFSMLFKKLSDYARKHGDERGRLPIWPVYLYITPFEQCLHGNLAHSTWGVLRGLLYAFSPNGRL